MRPREAVNFPALHANTPLLVAYFNFGDMYLSEAHCHERHFPLQKSLRWLKTDMARGRIGRLIVRLDADKTFF